MASELNVEIGRRVREARQADKMTQEKLAERAELSIQFIAEIEAGKKSMTTSSLYKVARALHVPADYLVFGEETGDVTHIERMLSTLSDDDRASAEEILRVFIHAIRR
nr:helix-turn-helix transcriptional regulator [Maliibacterium massiliense]